MLLQRSYQTVLNWTRHPKAARYLGFVSFVDASVFPVSPLFMFIPMALAKPSRAFWYAWVCTVASVLGGIIGYALGFYAFEQLLAPLIAGTGYFELYLSALQWFQVWGFWAIVLSSLSFAIPYKIFTIGAGVLQLSFPGFLFASFLGRVLRFFLMAAIIYWGGPKMEFLFRRFVKAKEIKNS